MRAWALRAVGRLLRRRFPGVRWIEPEELSRCQAESARRPILLDARAPEEFAVSHLQGARRVDPVDADVRALDLPQGADVVVYCSLGYRSARVACQLSALGRGGVHNLDGGIFRWASEGRPLEGGAERVHPFSWLFGRLLAPGVRAPTSSASARTRRNRSRAR